MKQLYSFMLFLFIGGITLAQQADSLSLHKLDAGMKLALRQSRYYNPDKGSGITKRSDTSEDLIPVLIRCTDSETVTIALCEWGIEARVIHSSLVTARIPAASVNRVASLPQVLKVRAARKVSPTMAKSRILTGMDKVQSGEGLESPYTGKGVIVGVIDQGFEYTHPAFYTPEGKLRIKQVWNRYKEQEPLSDTEEIKAQKNDGMAGTHATHVTGIAAGSRVNGSEFHGNAPDAELVVVPSNFLEDEILEDVKFIQDYAASLGKPCVINMSLGAQIGPHDGTSEYDQAIDQMVGKGKIIVGAVGNDGGTPIHLHKVLSTEQDTLRCLLNLAKEDLLIYFLGSDERPFDIDFILYDPDTKEVVVLDEDELSDFIAGEMDVNDQNGKFYGIFSWEYALFKESMGIADTYLPGIRVYDAPANYAIHSWVNYFHASFTDAGRTDGYFTPGDNQYTICEIGSSPGRTLAVGSYDSSTEWTALDGNSYAAPGLVGEVSYFSNTGPQLDNNLPKPLICAPGSMIASAFSKQDRNFDPRGNTSLVLKVSKDEEDFYYGMQRGTSMASPQVAGIVACWMQAYPRLTPEQATEIIRKTALNDEFTGDVRESWHPQWGYGKINAYEGLKECIRLAAASGINDIRDSETPVSLYWSNDCWKICFNNEETEAAFVLYTLGGVPVMERKLSNVPCGHEEVLNLETYQSGCYLLTVQTSKARFSRKIVVR